MGGERVGPSRGLPPSGTERSEHSGFPNQPSATEETPVEQQRQYVGIDLHRRRSVIVRMTEGGEVLECVRIVNDPVALSLELAKAGPDPEVALEATYGWYWAADCCRPMAPTCIWCIRWVCTGTLGGSRTTSGTPPSWRIGCAGGISRVLDRAGGGAGAAGAHPLPGEAGGVAHLGQGAGPRGDGQARDPADPVTCSARPARSCSTRCRSRARTRRVDSLRGLLERYERRAGRRRARAARPPR